LRWSAHDYHVELPRRPCDRFRARSHTIAGYRGSG
jgi:hypothetical protein